MTEPLSPDHVQRFLDRFELGLRVKHYEDTTATSEDAARAIGCDLGQIAKSMCLMVDGRPVLVVASGDVRLSDAKVARLFEVGRKKVRIATPEQCVDLFGFPPGGVAPVGHRTPEVTVILDASLSRWDTIHAAAGTPHDNFTLSFDQLRTITGAAVHDCARDG